MRISRRTPAAVLLPVAAYLLLFVLSFYPQSLRPWDTVGYVGDSTEATWIVAWNVHQFFKNPLKILDANILYPNPRPITYTDHRILSSLVGTPVIWATGNPVLAYNFVLAVGCLLAALAARRLARRLGCAPLPAWAAGALYAFSTYMVNEGPRFHIIYHGLIPLALERLIAFLKTGERRYAVHCAAFMILQGLCSSYHVLYGALLLALVTLVALVWRPRLMGRRVVTLVAIALLAALLYAPILAPYLISAHQHGFKHEPPAGVDLAHYFSTIPTNLVYGRIGAEVRLQQQAAHFVGFLPLALVGLALWAWARRRGPTNEGALLPARVWVPGAALFALLFVILSLGKETLAFGHRLGPGLYLLVYNWIPGFKQVRIPERLSLLAMLFVALLVARALTLLGGSRLRWLVPVLVILIPLEHLSPLPVTERVPVGREVPAVYRWLAAHEVRALAEVPIHGDHLIRKESLQMYFSSYHFKPIIHGYESFPPLLTTVLRMFADEFPSDAALQAFDRVGVDTIVLHDGLNGSERIRGAIPERVAGGRLQPVARFAGNEAHVYQGTADEVFRLLPALPGPIAPFPAGRRRLAPGWTYRAKVGDPALAADGDVDTAWTVPGPLKGDEFYEVRFDKDKAIPVEGLVVRLRRDSRFPTAFKIAGRDSAGQWLTLARFDGPHKLQLLERLLSEPRDAGVGFDLGGRELTGLMIMVEPEGRSHLGWSIPEIEVMTPCNCYRRKAHISTESRVSRYSGLSSTPSRRTKALTVAETGRG
jgi:hypothetical protein